MSHSNGGGHWTFPAFVIALMVAIFVIGFVALPVGFYMPEDVSKDGHRVTWLIEITMLFLSSLFVVMAVWMGIAFFKHSEGRHEAEYDPGTGKSQMLVAATISGGIFFIVDGNLFASAMKNVGGVFWNFEAADQMPDVLRIEVNAHQWAWDARYAGPDGEWNTQDDVVTTNDIRVPVDTEVLIQLASVDVIHSFNLPNMRVKQDAVPGYVNGIRFQAVKLGTYEIACAQHCGTHHYKMKGHLTVLGKDEFADWTSQSSARDALAFDASDEDAHWGWAWEAL